MASYRERFLFTLNDDGSDIQSTKTGRTVKLDRNETMELQGLLFMTNSMRRSDEIMARFIGKRQVKLLTENKYKIIKRERIDEPYCYGYRIYCSNGLTFELIRTETFGNNDAYWYIFEYDNGCIKQSKISVHYRGTMTGSKHGRLAISEYLETLNRMELV